MKNAGVNNEREYDFKVEDIISLNDCPPKMLLARMCWEIQHPKPCAQDTGIQTKLIN
jgi:hypothetical protein